MLDNNVLMLVRPSSGEHTFYKVKDANSIVLTDSVGNEPEGENAKFYVLKSENIRLIKTVDSVFATHVFYKSSQHITLLIIYSKILNKPYIIDTKPTTYPLR